MKICCYVTTIKAYQEMLCKVLDHAEYYGKQKIPPTGVALANKFIKRNLVTIRLIENVHGGILIIYVNSKHFISLHVFYTFCNTSSNKCCVYYLPRIPYFILCSSGACNTNPLFCKVYIKKRQVHYIEKKYLLTSNTGYP